MRYKPVRWTPKEDAVLRSVRSDKAAARLFPGRALWNVKMRRKALGLTKTREPRWTKSEDKRLLKFAHEPMSKLEKRFKNRTRQAIRTRRTALGITKQKSAQVWSGSEIKRLKALYATATQDDLIAAFPRHTWISIKQKASAVGLRRTLARGAETDTLHEQVRTKARENGISLGKLGAHTNNITYFYTSPAREDYNRIARAVEFLGGRLKIDWQDE